MFFCLQDQSLECNLSYANHHVSVLEIDIVRVSMTFKPGIGSKIKRLASGSTAVSVTLCIPNLVIFLNVFIAICST